MFKKNKTLLCIVSTILLITLDSFLIYGVLNDSVSPVFSGLFICISIAAIIFLWSRRAGEFNQSLNEQIGVLLVLTLTAISFFPVFNAQLLNWDDPVFIGENPLIRSLSFDNLIKIFNSVYEGNYQPFVMLSLAFDYAVSELNPFTFHLHNLLLHILNTYLVYLISKRIFRNYFNSIALALIFGISSVHVESIVWITERKDVLYSFYFLLSLKLYFDYVLKAKTRYYFLSLLLFVFAVLAKSQAVVLSGLLFLVDYLYKRNFSSGKVIVEKLAFLAIAFVAIYYTFHFSVGQEIEKNIIEKIVYAVFAYGVYFIKSIIPFNLSPVHPYPEGIGVIHIISVFAVVAILSFILLKIKSRTIVFGILFYTISIFPLLQFFPTTYSIISDRYVYIASFGVYIVLSELYLIYKRKLQNIVPYVLPLLVVYLMSMTIYYSMIWQNSYDLWTYTVEKYPESIEAWNNRGNANFENQKYQQALADFTKAVNLKPNFADPYLNRGTTLIQVGRAKNAISDFNKAIKVDPYNYKCYQNRAIAYNQLNMPEKSISDFTKAIELNSKNAEAFLSRGAIYSQLKDREAALNDYSKALQIQPDNQLALANRGLLHARMKNYQSAISDLQKCIDLGTQIPDVYQNLGFVYFNNNMFNKAIANFNIALSLNPNFAMTYLNRGKAYLELGYKAQACNDFFKASQMGIAQAEELININCK